ncbi:MAG: PIN domain-containing protein [Patescibacteria group bacterium]
MKVPLIIVVDADAIIAQAFTHDTNHDLAMKISNHLHTVHARMIYPSTAIMEAITVLQTKLNSGATAYGTAVVFTDPHVEVAEVGHEDLQNAVDYFSPTGSKKHTLFDCVIAAIAEKNKADAIFSFDKFYKTKGFTLASELK